MSASAIQATFSDFKLIKGRKCAQLVFEVPIEAADAALDTLGGLPRPDQEAWCGIARINPAKTAEKAASEPVTQSASLSGDKVRRRFNTLPMKQQAAMRCNEAAFQRFLSEEHSAFQILDPETAAAFVRGFCGVKSRSEIVEGSEAAEKWLGLDGKYDLWMRAVA